MFSVSNNFYTFWGIIFLRIGRKCSKIFLIVHIVTFLPTFFPGEQWNAGHEMLCSLDILSRYFWTFRDHWLSNSTWLCSSRESPYYVALESNTTLQEINIHTSNSGECENVWAIKRQRILSIMLQLLEYKILRCHDSSMAGTFTMQTTNGFFYSMKLYVAH